MEGFSRILGSSPDGHSYATIPVDYSTAMEDKIVAEPQGQGHHPYPYSPTYPQQSFQQQQNVVSPQPSIGQFQHAQPISPESISHPSFPQNTSAWFDPQSPSLRDSPGYDRTFDSHRSLMSHDPANVLYEKTPDVHVTNRQTNDVQHKGPFLYRAMKSKWSMIACLIIGAAAAIGHHFFYNHLDGQEAKNQQWMLRAGQLISFIANANFILAAVMAHQQVAWRAVGQNGFSIHAVDSLFGATHNLVELFNREAWAKSWFVMFLALYMWLSPAVVILTSATLYVVPGESVQDTLCPSIRTLNFSNEAKESYQSRKMAEGEAKTMTGRSLCSYNWTALGGNEAPGAKTNDSIFEYYNGPSPILNRIAAGVFSSGQTTYKANISEEICGEGWDCSTTIHFVAPGYQCEELANGVGSSMKKFGDAEAPFDLDKLVPAGNFAYFASNDRGEYMKPQIDDVRIGGIPPPEAFPDLPKNLGVFRTEPSIWIGYATVQDYTKEHAKDNKTDGWNDDYTPIIFACDHWEVNYTVEFHYTAGFQTYNITDREYKKKIIDTEWYSWTNESTDGTADGNVAKPDKNYVSPRHDFARYRRIAAFHSLGLLLRNILAGNVQVQGGSTSDGAITTTNLLDRHETLPVQDLQKEVGRIYEDLIISLLSDPQLLAVAWAADPSKLSGTGVGREATNYACQRRRKTNFFDYGWSILIAVYSVSFIIASVGVYYGIKAMTSDGTDAQRVMTFSTIAGATKKVSVDEAEGRATKIRCFPTEERPGEYEFRAELEG
ncbi:hypothetical protein FPSE_11023 [Fusarium pseudograminearum CS3096]|uniref:Uncharacterized protein n=1 Tax=Fusarium pseudograminearum (strain CS3096) TaxID=1028729 RepID=K3UBP0_FUSPC|nr:hypothetical protein FPSE_11023 [Fusarium pseudograminearum CS3096]EKJ68806.1 hypothetical protein FPSE_11023 [Fusarium pseudograminearum CS3096]